MKEHTQNEQAENTGPPAHKWPALTVDWDMLGQCLEDSDLTDDEIRETIEAYWALAVAIVDLSLGIHPAQMVTKTACEQNGQNANSNTEQPLDLVKCDEYLKSIFNRLPMPDCCRRNRSNNEQEI